MKLKYFKKRLDRIIEIYNASTNKDLALEKVFGGDTSINTVDITSIVDKMLLDLADEVKDTYELIEVLVYEHMLRVDYEDNHGKIIFKDKSYNATPKVIFKLIKSI